MSGLLDSLMSSLGPQVLQQMAGKLGASPQQTETGLAAALPVLLGAMQRNASNPQGAAALQAALQKDHAGADLGQLLNGVLGVQRNDGAAILGHVLGARSGRAAQGVGAASGLSGAQSQDLLAMLAPLVMGALGKQGAGGGADLGAVLGGATQQLQQQGGGLGSKVMTAVLDRDGDGDVDFADLMAMAQGGGSPSQGGTGGLGGLLGGLLGGGR